RAIDHWEHLLVSHRGQWSVERLLAFDAYCVATSPWRVAMVLLLTPMPSLVLLLLIELVPLQAPELGALANYGTWVRLFGMCVFITLTSLLTSRVVMPQLLLTKHQITIICMVVSICYVLTMLGISCLWVSTDELPSVIANVCLCAGLEVVSLLVMHVVVRWQYEVSLLHLVAFALESAMDQVQGKLMLWVLFCFQFPVKHYASTLRRTMMACARRACSRGVHFWEHLLVSHRGQWSVERLLAFDAYCASTSPSRIAMVLLLTPIPSVILALLIELVPLQAPELGALANYGAWARVFGMCVFITSIALLIARVVMPQLHLARWQMAAICVLVAACYVLILLAISCLWVFPVPFLLWTGFAVYTSSLIIVFVLVIGCEPLKQIPDISRRSKQYVMMISIVMSLATIMPMYEAAFLAINPKYQLALMLALPVIKLVAKNAVFISTQIGPMPCTSVATPHPSGSASNSVNYATEEQLKSQARTRVAASILKALFFIDCFVLVEYLECIVPIIYAVYLPITYHWLPSAKYHPALARISADELPSVIANMCLCAGLEVASLLVMHVVIRRHYNVSLFHLVAFALETQLDQILGKLMLWVMFCLQFPVTHYGVDFTFQFAWLRRATTPP
ncbi:TPA: hypothetical protein N0F65_001239, partial [Lagenidium giganteum]